MKSLNVPLTFPAAHIWAWLAGAFLAFWPFAYQGQQSPPEGGPQTVTMSLVEANGLYVLLLLAIPIVLTASAWMLARGPGTPTQTRVANLWLFAIGFSLLCLIGILSIGLFYVPAAIALLAGAFRVTRSRVRSVRG